MKKNIFKVGFVALLAASLFVGVNTSCTSDETQKVVADSIVNNMVLIEGGTYMMGNDNYEYDYQSDEAPAHKVTLDSFYICKYEVTQREWTVIMGSNPSDFTGESDKNPVENVSWLKAQEFIKRLNELTSKNFRLPTEAEWEFAARGGNKSHGYKYAGNDDPYEVGCVYTPYEEATQEVGLLNPNELGLFDMTGNVNELCNDAYDKYEPEDQVNPKGPSSASVYRVARGGGWCNARRNCTVTSRLKMAKQECGNGVGLRLVMDAKK